MDTFYVICRGNPGIFISFLSSEKKKVWRGERNRLSTA